MSRLKWFFAILTGAIIGACSAIPTPMPPRPITAVPSAPDLDPRQKTFPILIWGTDQPTDAAAFERAAARAKAAGATHMVVSDALPRAMWEYEETAHANDPYPAWYVYRPSLFKIFTPAALRTHIPQAYANAVAEELARRCAILRRHGLQGIFQANEPQVLPESVFREHPLWRGPRVDQANRSRAPHFAACVDQPEVLALYRESVAAMVRRCPEITMLRFATTDAGSGLCWSPGLYPGQNGPHHCKDHPMSDRVKGFLTAIQTGAKDANSSIEVRLVQIEPEDWMVPTFADPVSIARLMPSGTAINNLEAPAATPYASSIGWANPMWSFFNPVRGIPNPAEALSSLRTAFSSRAPRLQLHAPRGYDDLYARLFEVIRANPPLTTADEAALLHKLAVQEVGDENAEHLVQVWLSIAKANDFGMQLKFAFPSTLGGVHQRWLTRPFVPFAEELPAAHRDYYRKHIFQAKGEKQAEDLVDIQGMHLYEGWSGRMWVLNVYNRVEPELKKARARLATLIAKSSGDKRAEFELLDRKLNVFLHLCTNARNAVDYQAALTYLKSRKAAPGAATAPATPVVDENPPLGALESWDRKMILEIARREIDNTAELLELLKASPIPLIEMAVNPADEDITLLGPNTLTQMKLKIDIMNAHWEDYKRLTTTPNP